MVHYVQAMASRVSQILVKGIDMNQVTPKDARLATRLSALVQSSWLLASFRFNIHEH